MCLAIPGKVLEIKGDDPLMRTGRVQFGGVVKEVNLAYTPDVEPDQYVLVHVGFALSVLDEAEAERTLQLVRELESDEDRQREASDAN